jgi:hypothetical protein
MFRLLVSVGVTVCGARSEAGNRYVFVGVSGRKFVDVAPSEGCHGWLLSVFPTKVVDAAPIWVECVDLAPTVGVNGLAP